MDFGDKLKELRKEKGMNQKELGEILGVSDKTISTWEKGTREPTMKIITIIADLFDVKTDFLLGHEPRYGYDDILEIVKAYEEATKEQKEQIKKIIKVITKK